MAYTQQQVKDIKMGRWAVMVSESKQFNLVNKLKVKHKYKKEIEAYKKYQKRVEYKHKEGRTHKT